MLTHEVVGRATRDTVLRRPFTGIPGLPTWEQKEKLLEETGELSMDVAVIYDLADDHGLLPKITEATKCLALTGKNYVAPPRPPVVAPEILNQTATDKQAKILTANNNQAKLAVVQGFRPGFGHNFKNAFNKKIL